MTNVLVIDDSDTTRMYYREVLEAAGLTVHEAMNGLEGLEKAMSDRFDLILVDVNMPKMDGYTFLDRLRRSPENRAIPAIMISTQAREADRTRAHAAGANLYLVKPVNPEELTAQCSLMTGARPPSRRSV